MYVPFILQCYCYCYCDKSLKQHLRFDSPVLNKNRMFVSEGSPLQTDDAVQEILIELSNHNER